MCQSAEHEQLCAGVIWCPKDRVLRIWMSKLRKTLGCRYDDMSDMEVLVPVVAAAADSYFLGKIERVDVVFGASYMRGYVEGPQDAA